ncbi:nucleic acid/nucleotide deaminase domain-containing protein [Streptomyces anulatus]|uniref:nucleic acid/nucleotide deaminase domain-containing protein n=1 Tax=Streptomyces anulatus TaxID=1892 RepID=UPI0036A45746
MKLGYGRLCSLARPPFREVLMPSPDSSAELVQHFGSEGLRLFRQGSLLGAELPVAVRDLLQETGVPRGVGPYFFAAGAEDPVTLGVLAARVGGLQPSVPVSGWLRIGFDGLAHLCVRPDGAVQAVVLSEAAEDMFVSTDVASLNASLLALDRAQTAMFGASGLAEGAAVFQGLAAELRRIDASAFVERESWWPRVLDDIRHTLNFPFSAAFEYVDGSGSKQVVTEVAGVGRPHPEEALWRRLSAEGVEPGQVRRVHCELEPCLMPGHYCSVWMQQVLPHAEFTHSFDYGDTAESREEGLKQLILHDAETRRRG